MSILLSVVCKFLMIQSHYGDADRKFKSYKQLIEECREFGEKPKADL